MNKNSLIIILVVAAVAYGLGRYATPAKAVTVEKEAKAVDTSTTTRETIKKDGTVIKEVIKNNIVKVERDKSQLVISKKPDWKVSVSYDTKQHYGVEVQRRVLGAVFVGAGYRQDGTINGSIGYEF
jgi:hypothetical protein